jgi:transposase-like protein
MMSSGALKLIELRESGPVGKAQFRMIVLAALRRGLTIPATAQLLGVSEASLQKWRREDPMLRSVKKRHGRPPKKKEIAQKKKG